MGCEFYKQHNMPELNGRKLSNLLMRPPKTLKELLVQDDDTFYCSSHFRHMLRMERKRTGRSGKPFLLMLINLSGLQTRKYSGHILERIREALVSSSRETDIRGWYEHDKIMSAIFTEMGSVDNATIEKVFKKLCNNISNSLGTELLKKIEISLHVFKFPEESDTIRIASGL
jgi:hypothetical protein